MNAVVVYKTTDLHNAVSGISGTIDLRTRRPFDLKDGFTVSGTGEYARGRDTKDNDYLFSGLASWRKGNFGILASGAYSKATLDRKSTRLNSRSLMRISYAVFCLKKNTNSD